jgi:DNA recombination protein RmuC
MTLLLAVLQILTLLAVIALLLRRREAKDDPRVTAFATELPAQFARLETRLAAVDEHLRSNVAQLRTETAAEAQAGREAADRSATALRTEVMGSVQALGDALRSGLDSFRTDNARGAEALRTAVDGQLGGLTQRFMGFSSDNAKQHGENRDSLESRLTELGNQYAAQQEKLRASVEDRLDRLNRANADKLEEMRQTVDEKLHTTLHTRLTESFGHVNDTLTKVHAGLGEMTSLAAGVGDIKKMLTNVKSRGIVGEYFLGQQLEQMFSPDQYIANARIKPNTQESVEFALKVPNGPDSTVLLALDSKFPLGDWERLEEAYETGSEEERRKAGVAFL